VKEQQLTLQASEPPVQPARPLPSSQLLRAESQSGPAMWTFEEQSHELHHGEIGHYEPDLGLLQVGSHSLLSPEEGLYLPPGHLAAVMSAPQ
jgi:hypothetical protein